MNTHNDHDATCLCCKHCYISFGEPHYSSWTPGNPGTLQCAKKHFGDHDIYALRFKAHDLMMKGQDCPDFQGKESD